MPRFAAFCAPVVTVRRGFGYAQLARYFKYYHRSRPHLALEKECPIDREVMKHGATVEISELGGLHHRYERIAG